MLTNRRKGMGELIGAILVIAITIIVAIFVSGWISSTSEEHGQRIKNQTQEKLSCIYADLYIDNVTFNCSNNCSSGITHLLNITIKNSGQVPVSIEKIYIINTTGSVFTFNLSEIMTIATGGLESFISSSTISCLPFNRTIDKVVVSSVNCPDTAYDRFDGDDVTFVECG